MFKATTKAKRSKMRGEKKNQCLNYFNGLTWPQKIKKFIFFFSWDLIQSPLRPKEGFAPIPMCAGSILCSAAPSLCCVDGLKQQLPQHSHPSALCSRKVWDQLLVAEEFSSGVSFLCEFESDFHFGFNILVLPSSFATVLTQ